MKRNMRHKNNPDHLTQNNHDLKKLKQLEKQWQDTCGHDLIDASFSNDGSRIIYYDQFDRIINTLISKNGARILEVGCGGGHFIKYARDQLKSKNLTLVGLDISSNVIEISRNNYKETHWIVADGEALPFSGNTFDAVIFNGSLHHMPDFTAALHEAFRVARNKGQVILQEPVSTLFSRTVHHLLDPFVFKKVQYESPVDVHCKNSFRPKILRKVIIDAGHTFRESWHDFLAYPLTGCYANSFFSRKPGLLKGVLKFEKVLQKMFIIKNILKFFCWRMFLDIRISK